MTCPSPQQHATGYEGRIANYQTGQAGRLPTTTGNVTIKPNPTNAKSTRNATLTVFTNVVRRTR